MLAGKLDVTDKHFLMARRFIGCSFPEAHEALQHPHYGAFGLLRGLATAVSPRPNDSPVTGKKQLALSGVGALHWFHRGLGHLPGSPIFE